MVQFRQMDDIIRPRRPKTPVKTEPEAFKNIPSGPSTQKAANFNTGALSKIALKSAKSESKFKTPDEVADEDIAAAAIAKAPETINSEEAPAEEVKKRKFSFKPHMPHGKKQWIIASIIAVLVLGGGSASAYFFVIKKPAKAAPVVAKVVKKAVPPKTTTEVSKLSGLSVPIGTNLGPVTAVQIENSPDARPQSGLKEASIVYEAIAEGGITRFNAIFQDTAPDYIGPIRSLRPYYIDWFLPFDASIAHVGGAPQALQDIKTLGIKDLDQFYNGGSYDRITSRYAPHNVYTSVARLNDLEKSKGFTSATYTGFLRKKDAVPTKPVTPPTAKIVDLSISSYFYNVHYDYDAAKNAYLRSEGGAPHLDLKSSTQLEPKVVVAIVMGRGIDGDGEHTDYTTVGSGHMYVFQDGAVQEGTWAKDSRQAQWKFTTADGKPIAFNAGQTWISMVDSTGSVTYAP
ncbi:MAG: hypothetical protein JWO47_500 [Candidatus Saccharibacteria bacterium]|nr:hypothetical protein [Candidatus Saccharibacteria bacterium]